MQHPGDNRNLTDSKYGSGDSCFDSGITGTSELYRKKPAIASIDIIIATFGRPLLTVALVNNLLRQCMPGDRVIVVWQGRQKPQLPGDMRITLLHQRIPGLPAARNIGLEAGKNPIVLYIDDDCEALGGLLDAHRSAYADPSIGAVAGYVDDPLFGSGISVPSKFNITNGEVSQNFHIDKSGPAITLMGANMSFKRTALEKTGGFDVNYRHNAMWEDVDAAFRVQNEGYALWYCAEARVRHLRESDGGCRNDAGRVYLYYYFRNTAYFACTYAPRVHKSAWIRFWLYRLEYFSRKKNAAVARFPFRHRISLVCAGLSGAIAGCIIYMIKGIRRPLPAAVVQSSGEAS